MNPQSKRITIGRKPGNTIVLNSHDVSGTHAALTLITPVTNTWEIQDMGSANGTFVDGIRIFRKEVTPANMIKLGQTTLTWDLILDRKLPVLSESVKHQVPDRQEAVLPNEEIREIAWGLKNVSEEYREKRNRLAEIQAQEAFNGRIQGASIFFGGGISAFLTTYDTPQLRVSLIGIGVTAVTMCFILLWSRKLAKERKTLNSLDDWYKTNYVCPHCHTFIQQPFQLLEKTKNCRACKKPLIP